MTNSKLEQILKSLGPMTTSRAAALLRESGLSVDAARKAVSRRRNNVATLHGLPFPKRARFIYFNSQFSTQDYWKGLNAAIQEENPAFAVALNALEARDGIVLKRHFNTICGSPLKQKGQLAGSSILSGLLSSKLVSILVLEGFGECVVLGQNGLVSSSQIKSLKARLLTEGVLLDAIRTWAAKMNMSTLGTIKIRDENPSPRVGTCEFDLSGPSYLLPLVSFNAGKPNPGFLAADVILGQDLTARMAAAFIRKCTLLANLGKSRPVLAMLVADSFTPEALRTCRSRGIIATRPETLFGQDVARALTDLLKTLAATSSTPSQIEGLFKRLGAIEGAAGNLRGALFELVVGHCVLALEGGNMDLGLTVTDLEQNRAEIDVRLIKEKQVTVYECKGYQPTSRVSAVEIEKWLSKKVPTIYRALRKEDRFSSSTISFQFWTCGEFEDDAIDLIDNANSQTSKYSVSHKNGSQIRQYATGLVAPGIRKILDEHYFNNPLKIFVD